MATEIALHHIGEVVLAGMLRRLGERGELDAECMCHKNCGLAAVLGQSAVGRPICFHPNVQLESVMVNGETLLFDGAHGIDVLCAGSDFRGLAFEAKLGLDRMGRGEFMKRFLTPVSLTSHTRRRIRGKMVAILNYRALDGGAPLPLRTVGPSPVALVSDWFLVVRRAVWRQWRAGKSPLALLSPHTHVTIFEDIVDKHGGGEAFDRLVQGLVGSEFFEAWALS